MEIGNIGSVEIPLEKAREWFKKGGALREIALNSFTEEELDEDNFRSILTFIDAENALHLNQVKVNETLVNIERVSKAAAASFKLNIIRRALNMDKEMSFIKGKIWFPFNPLLAPGNNYDKDDWEVEVAKVQIRDTTYTLMGGHVYCGSYLGTGDYDHSDNTASTDPSVGFLGCATKGIAQHMGVYFAREIFEAKYGDTVNYKWI